VFTPESPFWVVAYLRRSQEQSRRIHLATH
jgi:hypothetical protein